MGTHTFSWYIFSFAKKKKQKPKDEHGSRSLSRRLFGDRRRRGGRGGVHRGSQRFSGGGCYSSVGYNHRSHQVSIQRRGCTLNGIVAHELGHTIGLHHEQCRPDRDNSVKILLNNVPSNMRYNFNKVQGTSNFGMPYDYCSLMHYGATAFGGRKFTIIPKDFDYLAVIGKSHTSADLTYTDAAIVNTMYNCNRSTAQTSCPKVSCTSRWSASTCRGLQSMLG